MEIENILKELHQIYEYCTANHYLPFATYDDPEIESIFQYRDKLIKDANGLLYHHVKPLAEAKGRPCDWSPNGHKPGEILKEILHKIWWRVCAKGFDNSELEQCPLVEIPDSIMNEIRDYFK